jgi:hypothetical protein
MPKKLVEPLDRKNQPEVDLLLSCARTKITPEISRRIQTLVEGQVNWIRLIQLALCHEVMPLLYRNLQQVCPESVPEDVLGALCARYQSQSARARGLAGQLGQMLALLKEEGIFAVPYKGPALAERLYGDLSLRPFNDLDIMVRERDIPKASELVRRFGYELLYPDDIDKLREQRTRCELSFYRSDGAILEFHWRFAVRMACVSHDPDRFLERLETISLAGAVVPSLPLEVYFLVLSIHATKHKWKQLKLICDIAEILARTDLDWHYVSAQAGNLGLRRMIAVGALLADDLLEATAPADLARELKIDRTTRALAAEVRRSLFKEPDETWRLHAEFPFQVKIRERLRDKVNMLGWNLLPKLKPDERDQRFLPMPEIFSFLYYFVRPVRWTWEKMKNEGAGRSTRNEEATLSGR